MSSTKSTTSHGGSLHNNIFSSFAPASSFTSTSSTFTGAGAASRCWSSIILLCNIFLLSILLLPLSYRPCSATQQTSLGVRIERSPESAVAPKGDEVLFECELNLMPERLEWRFRHTSMRAIDANNYKYLRSEDGYNITNEDRTSKLRITVSTETLGDYQCVAWFGSAAIASIPAHLTLVSISIDNSNGYSRNAIRWSVAPKNCLLIRCGTVTSNPPAVWSFYRNGEKVPQTEVLPAGGALILNSVSTKDSGNYTCSAMNAITGVEVRLPQRIDLRVDYTDRTPPFFLTQPPTQVTARPGETVLLECPGVGSPPPEAVWSSPNVANMYNNSTRVLPYGLQIVDVLPEHQGTYVCRLDNGIAPPLVHIIKFTVLERPTILRGPAATLTNEGEALELECSPAGNPYPSIYWLINGEDTSNDNETYHDGRRLVIQKVQKRHAGIVQCFAKNEVGEVSEGNLLQVNPRQIPGEAGAMPLGNVPTRSPYEHSNKNKGKRKHMKVANMIPPSRPNVTRLSDDSVMLRWYVPKNDGLPIQFFKVQYRMMGDSSRKIPRENWQTTNEDIPYGKRDRNFEGVKNFTSSVTGLKPDRIYRFRIIAVYSNNDNKEGNTSTKFYLQRGSALGPAKSNLPAPELVRIEPLSEHAVQLHWSLPANSAGSVDGFYAYYRPASSAGEYLKATVEGVHTRRFKIDNLEPGTAYEFKLQSFNALAASEFSAILQGKTKRLATTPSPEAPVLMPPKSINEEDNSIYPVIAGAAIGGIFLLIATIVACLCIKRRKNVQTEDEDKPQLDHIQADFVTPSVLGVSSHHKSGSSNGGHRLNGVLPRMNITPNPLAQEADKNRNVMELRFIPNTNNTNTPIIKNTTTTTATSNNKSSASTPSAAATLAATKKPKTGRSSDGELSSEDETSHLPPHRSSSSCETLEASEGINSNTAATMNTTTTTERKEFDPNSKPLPPLPTKSSSSSSSSPSTITTTNHQPPTTANKGNHTTPKQQQTANHNHVKTNLNNSNTNTNANNTNTHIQNCNSHNSQGSPPPLSHFGGSHQGLHHAQPYHQTPPPGTPTMLHKRADYQHPPPVPPHQNNNHLSHAHPSLLHHQHHHHSPPLQTLTPTMEQHRRTIDRSARNPQHYAPTTNVAPHDVSMNIDGLPTRIPSLRRTRRASGNANNNNGGVGIPIVPGSPRVQRSPMPARAMIKRNRLGSHNDNISSGSLNSIEV